MANYFNCFFVLKTLFNQKKLHLFQDIGSEAISGVWTFFYNYFNKYVLPRRSFEEGMGQNIVGYFLRAPFILIRYLAAPVSMTKIYVFIVLAKIISGSCVFYLFLKQLKVKIFRLL